MKARALMTPLLTTALLFGGTMNSPAAGKKTCLVLGDGYASEYAWGVYAEGSTPPEHPGWDYFIRGVTEHASRFSRWLDGWDVRRIDLETQQTPLALGGVDLVILDDVRQSVCDPYEPQLVEFVRQGGGLLVYAGTWGLGGWPKTKFCATNAIGSYQHSPLGAVLPVEITATPDLEPLQDRSAAARQPEFSDPQLGAGIEPGTWEVYALHACKPRGQILARVDGKPLVAAGVLGKGRVVVYTGDDLAWIRMKAGDRIVSPVAGTLWRRLAALAAGQPADLPAVPDPKPSWERAAAFAHPDQPMNFLWATSLLAPPGIDAWIARDLVTHASTLIGLADQPAVTDKAGVQLWSSFGNPIASPASAKDKDTWMVNAKGEPFIGEGYLEVPCVNNPKGLQNMDARMASLAAEAARNPAVTYGHMGDEPDLGNCYCAHCRAKFRQEFGYEMPVEKNDFSPAFLDQWIDYQIFKNRSTGAMYARAARLAREKNPRLRMFASVPQTGNMTHGDDQFHTQAGFDLIWDHTYPGTYPVIVGLHAAMMEETADLQGRPYVPVLDLLQGFDSYANAPYMPPAEYCREMVWQAIANGVDSVGWFVYNYWFWQMPGTPAWEEIGRLGREVLEPLTPALYRMTNLRQPVGLVYCYSQEAVDGLKEVVWNEKEHPWKPVIRWWSHHATQEAYETLKYAHVPVNLVSEYRIMQGKALPWKALVIAYAEHIHRDTRKALERFIAGGGAVYLGANSTLDLPGAQKLPFAFDAKFNTWWPEDRKAEWNQRRVRAYTIGTSLQKAPEMKRILAPHVQAAPVRVDDPEVVWSVREAGEAQYMFFINDHQINPVSPGLRKKRQPYNHFMLMPMEFPAVQTTVRISGTGQLYPLLDPGATPMTLTGEPATLRLSLRGGDAKLFVLLPRPVTRVEWTAAPVRTDQGVELRARVAGDSGVIRAVLPVRVEIAAGGVKQTVYSATENGLLSWTAPFLKTMPAGPLKVTVTDLASGLSATGETK